MFDVGDYIVYGNNGVCLVEKVGPLESSVMSKEKIYYTLSPCYMQGSTIFTPADNQKVMMRPVMTKEEGLALIDEIKELDYLGITSEKSRESEYKEALQTGEALELVKVIKTISKRKEVRIAEGKKITATDEKYYRLAEERLYGELAVVLGVKKEDMPEFLRERIQQS